MKAICKLAGVTASKVFPHNLRHLFARTFYRISHDVAKLADLLGHSSIETTRIYLISTGSEHEKQLNRLQLTSSVLKFYSKTRPLRTFFLKRSCSHALFFPLCAA